MYPNCNSSMLESSADSFKYKRHSRDKITMITSMGGVLCNLPNGCFSNASHSYKLWLDPRRPCLVPASELHEVLNFTIEALSTPINSSHWFENIQNAINGDTIKGINYSDEYNGDSNDDNDDYINTTVINNRYDITNMNFIESSVIKGKELAIGLSIGAVVIGLLATVVCCNREHFKNFHITY